MSRTRAHPTPHSCHLTHSWEKGQDVVRRRHGSPPPPPQTSVVCLLCPGWEQKGCPRVGAEDEGSKYESTEA